MVGLGFYFLIIGEVKIRFLRGHESWAESKINPLEAVATHPRNKDGVKVEPGGAMATLGKICPPPFFLEV